MNHSSSSIDKRHHLPAALFLLGFFIHVFQWMMFDRAHWSGSAMAMFSQIDNHTFRIVRICSVKMPGVCQSVEREEGVYLERRRLTVLPTRENSRVLLMKLQKESMLNIQFPLVLTVYSVGLQDEGSEGYYSLHTRKRVSHAFESQDIDPTPRSTEEE